MGIVVSNIAARDQLPSQKDYSHILIAIATATNSTNNNEPGYVLDSDERTKWTSKGMDQALTLHLSKPAHIHRIDIEWDPDLPRTGRFAVEINGSVWVSSNMNGSMFASIEDSVGLVTEDVKIICGGNAENDLNGITTVSVYGHNFTSAALKEEDEEL